MECEFQLSHHSPRYLVYAVRNLLIQRVPRAEQQKRIDAYFEASSAYWKRIYESDDVEATIYRERRSTVLALVQRVALPMESAILEVGCGSGLTSVQLALDGYAIQAVDSVEAMVTLTRQHAERLRVSDRVITSIRDVHDLGFPDNSFDLVLKIGVAPWLHSLNKALGEVTRVLRPGGYLITTADNRWRFNYWLDPRCLPPLAGMRRRLRRVLERLAAIAPRRASASLHSIREFDAYLDAAGLEKIETSTVGFGPFSFLGYKLLPKSWGVSVHCWLQSFADRGVPVVRSMGAQYIVLARKPVTSPSLLAPPEVSGPSAA